VNCLLVRNEEVDDRGLVRVSGRRAEHLLKVLQCRPGQRVKMGVLGGSLGAGRVESVASDAVVLAWTPGNAPPPPALDLLLALPRPKVLKRLWAPLASLGVGRIILANAARVERNYFDTHWLQPEHYEPLLVEGLEQSGDTRRPEVSIHRRFRPLVEDDLDRLCPVGPRFAAHPGKEASPPRKQLPADARILLAVGPEGGWTPFELALLEQHGFRGISLGWRTLRTDVACIALLSVLQHMRSESS
jgi:RsmE family RNA methyltransferase